MLLKITLLPEKKLVGKRMNMSLTNNRTGELWRSFMPNRKDIKNSIGIEFYSVEIYNPLYFEKFSYANEFEKWAAVEVSDLQSIPEALEALIIPTGLYAVFLHKGVASDGPTIYRYIFQQWLPKSDYILDNRPHFAMMGEKYKNDDAGSEEELWVPVKPKAN